MLRSTTWPCAAMLSVFLAASLLMSGRALATPLEEKPVSKPTASRPPPPRVEPITVGSVRYEAPLAARGVVVALDAKSGKERWRVTVVHRHIDPRVETDVQFAWIKTMTLAASGKSLLIEDEGGLRYELDLARKASKILSWPMGVRFVAWTPTKAGWRYRVELRTTNPLDRVVKFDGLSVAEGGELSNNLFRVTVDGVEVDYRGELAKRAPPDTFIELRPGQGYTTEVELGEAYPVPAGPHRVGVAFSSTNHFSPDGFTMGSAPVEQRFEGAGVTPAERPTPE